MESQTGFVKGLRDNRIKNTARIAIVSLIFKIAVTVIPFFIRSAMIYCMGDEYAGLNSLLISILSMLNMTELGLSGVIVYFLFEPLANGDIEKTEAYLNVLKKIYRYVAGIILIVGMLLTPFLHLFIKNDIPINVDLYKCYLVFLLSLCLSYFLVPEASVLMNASQRGDLDLSAGLISYIITYALEIVAIIVFKSMFFYYMAQFVQSCVLGIIRMWIMNKHYPGIKPEGNLSDVERKEIKKRILALFGHQMNDKFFSSIDSIVLSSFMGLSVVAIYGNYMYPVFAVVILLSAIFDSLISSMGNAFVTESPDSNYVRFKAVLWLNGLMTVWASVCMACIYQPFMKLWMGNRLFSFDTVILFCVFFYMMQIRKALIVFKNANGMWWEDRFKPYISLAVNLIIDIILVNTIGVNGALISSIVCIILIEIPWEGKVLYNNYFNKSVQEYFSVLISFFTVGVLIAMLCLGLCSMIIWDNAIITIVIRGIICSILSVCIILFLYRNSDEMRTWKETVLILIKERRKTYD